MSSESVQIENAVHTNNSNSTRGYCFVEYTDTYGGEANYCWVRRFWCAPTKDLTMLQLVRMAKKACGLTGHPCRTEHCSGMIYIYPRNICTVCFVTVEDVQPEGVQIDEKGEQV